MKNIFLFLLILICFKGFGQVPNMTVSQVLGSKKTMVTSLGGLGADSVFFYPTGCGSPSSTPSFQSVSIKKSAAYFDSCNHRYWLYDPKRLTWDSLHLGVAGGGNFDTTTIYSNLALKLNISDTASMLANYFNQVGYGLLRTGQVVRLDTATVFPQIRSTIGNFATTNLTQTAARTYAGAGFNYTLNNLGSWNFNMATGKSFNINNTSNLYVTAVNGANNSSLDVFPTYVESLINTATSTTQSYLGQGYISFSTNKDGKNSDVNINSDSIYLQPNQGIIGIDSLRTAANMTNMKVMLRNANGGVYEIAKDSIGNSNSITTAGDLSPLFTTTETAGNIAFTASSVSPYTLYGRASGSGVPSFITGIDSNWVAGLHTEIYYNTKYAAIGAVGGITTLNTLTGATQTFATASTGTDFTISSTGTTHTFSIPSASTTARGLVTTSSQIFAGAKTFKNDLYWQDGGSSIVGGLTNTTVGAALSGLIFLNSGANQGQLYPSALTGLRTWQLPNASGTIALTTDIPAAGEAAFTETIEEFTGSTSSTVTVANTPKTSKARMVFFNGVRMQNSNVSIATTVFTLSGITRETSDVITVKYSY